MALLLSGIDSSDPELIVTVTPDREIQPGGLIGVGYRLGKVIGISRQALEYELADFHNTENCRKGKYGNLSS
ncbi:MAG: hypothetical protein MUO43_10170 [Desulfobacterales bacterium]|nr:hypothetical protein [Desulfobacterales bacterium]